MHISVTNISILYFYVFYMFRTGGYIFKKTVVYTGTVWYVVHV